MLQLAYPLTETVEIDGKTYELDMSFDNVLRLLDMLNDEELDDATQVNLGIEMLIGEQLKIDMQTKEKILSEIFSETIGKDAKENVKRDILGNPMPTSEEEKENPFSFKQDGEYIYASFMQDYGIDLIEQQGKMHWSKFKALLSGLRDDTKFKEVLKIRTTELPSGKGTEKERERLKKLKEIYKLKPEKG